MNDISHRILEYKAAYETMRIKDIPPYRITCKEHKELIEICKQFMVVCQYAEEVGFKATPLNPTSMIKTYYGIDIEVVMIVDAYL